MTMMKQPLAVDVEVGRRVRERRMQLGVSQEALAEAVGVTFQQIQKYEKGTNRISASRLVQIGAALRMAPASLLPDSDLPITDTGPVFSAQAWRVARDFELIASPKLRLAIALTIAAAAGAAAVAAETEAA